MRVIHLAWVLLLGAIAGLHAEQSSAPRDLGRVIFIGDSITHGVGSASYRWPLHKILVDNGIRFNVVGVNEGNRLPEGSVAPGTRYRRSSFNNRHCAITSERAYEVSGRRHVSDHLGGTDVLDWLGLDPTYDGPYKLPAGPPPDTCFILLGTNDMLGDYDGVFHEPQNMRDLEDKLLHPLHGDMSSIVASLRRANPQMRIVTLSIPTWAYHAKNDSQAAYDAIRRYNRALASWAEQQQVLFVDIFDTLADASNPTPGRGVPDFFTAEPDMQLHPSAQGDLLIAGQIGRALGYHAPTAGLGAPRTGAARTLSLAPAEQSDIPLRHPSRPDFTLTPTSPIGNGSTGGWDRLRGLHLSFGTGRVAGSFTISECYIIWGDGRILFSADMSTIREPIRVAWVQHKNSRHIPSGFYIWLGDRLIGEALPPTSAAPSPILRLRNNTSTRLDLTVDN